MKLDTILDGSLMHSVLWVDSIDLCNDKLIEQVIDLSNRIRLLVDRYDFVIGELDFCEFVVDIKNVRY